MKHNKLTNRLLLCRPVKKVHFVNISLRRVGIKHWLFIIILYHGVKCSKSINMHRNNHQNIGQNDFLNTLYIRYCLHNHPNFDIRCRRENHMRSAIRSVNLALMTLVVILRFSIVSIYSTNHNCLRPDLYNTSLPCPLCDIIYETFLIQ